MNMPIFKIALLASALTAAPAFAQHDGHGEAEKPAAPAAPAEDQDHAAMDHSQMDHSQMDHGNDADAASDHAQHVGHEGRGPKPVIDMLTKRFSVDCPPSNEILFCTNAPGFTDGSGTARLPSAEGAMHGIHIPAGDWMVMAHGYLAGQFTDHKGPRGDDLLYSTSMAMLSGERSTEWGRVQLRAMLSLEPTMAARGYPNLFATGETADGEPLVDRQHPHDLFMELATRIDIDAGAGSLFLYGGPVGEPSIGPSAFMHRSSAAYNPEPPISHHWFDSTHITYGVVTAGYAARHWQIEASAFRGREPDEERWGIETPKLDSWSVRATLNPSRNWSIQASQAFLKSPEAGHGGGNEHRTTASIHYAGNNNGLSAMLAFSAKNRSPGDTLTAWLLEANYDLAAHHSLFARVENVANDELVPDHHDPLHDQAFRVGKAQLGYAWHSPIGDGPLGITLGGSANLYGKPAALDRLYGSNPWGYTLFARLSLGH